MHLIERLWHLLTRRLDGPLLFLTLILLALATATIYSALPEGSPRFRAHLINASVALGVMWVVAQTPPRRLMQLAIPAYFVGLLLLLGVALAGDVSKGARRWLNLGFMRIQPSEMMKIAVPLMIAWYYHRVASVLNWRHHLVATLLLALPVLLILRQPDLGTSILVASAGFFVIFFSGLSWKILFGLGGLAAAAAPFAWHLLHDYQQRRILTLLDPSADPLGAGYHILQSMTAIGAGGLTGKGYMNGTQSQLDFIPERHTDFILAVWSEEWGLAGNALLLVIYLLLIGRGLHIAANAGNRFNRLCAIAMPLIFFTYAFVNIGMVSGILPVVGVPLPLVSYGGTALVTLMTGIGILMSIQRHKTHR